MSSRFARAKTSAIPAADVSLFQLYLLRAGYLLLAAGLASTVWPAIVERAPWAPSLCPFNGIGDSLLAGLSILAVAGLRYPLKMLPLLLFELIWKAIWLTSVALPLWLAHDPIDAVVAETIRACLMAVVFVVLIPWRYVLSSFALEKGDRWA